uniref:Uncharacterized protein n=1 Tax=Mucochytrium quahogii TaxID=96639 RepID=A0A7S2WFG1_9STRA|mmetsp:Transcript_3756/g.5446  ORF Transcript_3756/g.5446 Transcript_3756/m.5446 type:complete len:375 (+) Transcript_3756:329-1453(+)|eukprot:CAMPEP_0203768668 /NCGR_PEP_ID=MMETSP0099_2-20121227/1721_1 /ASSEMBLY_ACC=CAM_ASM_000209 /TAXON_ID=96639 /ORGANISM=" , Strain NY0313808BC1" /LENGTH=374 /DNA_ID=CAMNT_0050665395 /DNA_START=317 /DNA_END=1441 /DNA_ORIENTATION=+
MQDLDAKQQEDKGVQEETANKKENPNNSDSDSDEEGGPSPTSGRFTEEEKQKLFSLITDDPDLLRAFLHQLTKRKWGGKSWMNEIAKRFNALVKNKRKHDAVRHHLKLRKNRNGSGCEDEDCIISLLRHTISCFKKETCSKCFQLHRLRVKMGFASCGLKHCSFCDSSKPHVLSPYDPRELLASLSSNKVASDQNTGGLHLGPTSLAGFHELQQQQQLQNKLRELEQQRLFSNLVQQQQLSKLMEASVSPRNRAFSDQNIADFPIAMQSMLVANAAMQAGNEKTDHEKLIAASKPPQRTNGDEIGNQQQLHQLRMLNSLLPQQHVNPLYFPPSSLSSVMPFNNGSFDSASSPSTLLAKRQLQACIEAANKRAKQ